jgi:hypothetical protein
MSAEATACLRVIGTKARRAPSFLLLAWAVLAPTLVGLASCTTPWIQDPDTGSWRKATVAETQTMIDATGKQLAEVTEQAVGGTYTPVITALTQLAALIFAWTVRPPTETKPPKTPEESQT